MIFLPEEAALVAEAAEVSAALAEEALVVVAPVGAGKNLGGIAAINASIPPRSFDYQFITSQSDTCYFNS